MKPDWEDAPDWAQFLIADACRWIWAEKKPKPMIMEGKFLMFVPAPDGCMALAPVGCEPDKNGFIEERP